MEKVIYSIYKITNIINGKCYIGYSQDVNRRHAVHKSSANAGSTKTSLYRAFKKYGFSNFTFDVIYQSLDKEHTLNEMEPYFIKEYNSFKKGYNNTRGGDIYPHSYQTWMLLSPEREIYVTDDLPSFAKERGLNKNCLTMCAKGIVKQHKKWLCKSIHKKTEQEVEQIKTDLLQKKLIFKKYLIVYPSGEHKIIDNVNKFAKENNLDQATLQSGNSHKGYFCYDVTGAEKLEDIIKEKAEPYDKHKNHKKFVIVSSTGEKEYVLSLQDYSIKNNVSKDVLRNNAKDNTTYLGYIVKDVTHLSKEEAMSMLENIDPIEYHQKEQYRYIAIAPSGDITEWDSIRKMCKELRLRRASVNQILSSDSDKKTKGYSFRRFKLQEQDHGHTSYY